MKLERIYRNLKFKQFKISKCNNHKFLLKFLRKKGIKKEFDKLKVNKESEERCFIEKDKKINKIDLYDIRKLSINKNFKRCDSLDIQFWILGELCINLNSNGEFDAFQILPRTKNVLFKLPEGTHIQRISDTEFIVVKQD